MLLAAVAEREVCNEKCNFMIQLFGPFAVMRVGCKSTVVAILKCNSKRASAELKVREKILVVCRRCRAGFFYPNLLHISTPSNEQLACFNLATMQKHKLLIHFLLALAFDYSIYHL